MGALDQIGDEKIRKAADEEGALVLDQGRVGEAHAINWRLGGTEIAHLQRREPGLGGIDAVEVPNTKSILTFLKEGVRATMLRVAVGAVGVPLLPDGSVVERKARLELSLERAGEGFEKGRRRYEKSRMERRKERKEEKGRGRTRGGSPSGIGRASSS